MAEGFRVASAYVQVDPDTSDFREKLQEELDEAVAGVHADVSVGLDTAEFDAGADHVKTTMSELDDLRAEPSVGLNAGGFDTERDRVLDSLDDLNSERAEPSVGLETTDFKAGRDEVLDKLDDLDAEHADPTVGLEDADFQAKMASANAQMTALNTRSANPTIGGGGGGGGAEGGEGSLLGALSLGVGSLLPGLGAAAAGVGLLGGTGLAAFGGIGKAIEAHSQAAQNVGITGAQLASTAFSNAVAVQQAQEQVGQAYSQAAMTARQAAMAQAQALQQVTQASQQEEEADAGLQQAQYNLSDAWIQARYALEQLRDEEQDSATTIRAAQVALQQAQYQQTLTDENAMSTALDRAQAAVQVTQAQEQLTSAQQNATYVQQEYNLQDKAGVAGSQQVVSAKQAVRAAVYAVRDAASQAQLAQKNLTDTELNDAAQVKQAQLAVVYAQRNVINTIREQALAMAATQSTSNQAANQFEKDMERLSVPARALVNQILSMHGAWKTIEDIAQTTVAPGITIFLKGIKGILPEIDRGIGLMGKAMGDSFGSFGKLMQTPAFKEGLSGLLTNGVQFASTVLPAFATFLQQLGKLGGQQGAATGLSNLFAGIAHGLTGMVTALTPYIPAINSFLTAVGAIIAQIGPPLGRIIGLVAQALGPLTRYLDHHPNGTIVKVIGDVVAGLIAFKGLQKLLPDFISGPLGKLASKGAGMIMSPFKSAAGKIPGLLNKAWGLAGQGYTKVFGAGGLIERGATWVSGVGSKIGGAFSNAWDGISGFGSKLGGMMSSAGTSVVQFVSNMGTQLAQAATATGTWIAEHAVAAATFVAENVTMAASATAAFVAENAATLGLVTILAAVVAAVVELGTHWGDVWGFIKSVALDLWHNVLDPMWQGIEAGAKWVYDAGIKPYFDLIKQRFTELEDAALWLWHNVLDPVWQGIQLGVDAFESGFSSSWHRIEGIFKTPVNFLIKTVYDNGIKRFWNDIVGAIGLGSLKLPEIQGLARGGIVGGTDRGYDSQLVAMRPGEGVLVPEAVRAIGPGTVHALNNTYGSGQSGGGSSLGTKELRRLGERGARKGGEHMLGFGGGGILGDIGGFFTSLGKGVWDSAKFMAELATNPVHALESALSGILHSPAAGDLGKIMTGIPKTLIKDLASLITGGGGGSGSTGYSAASRFGITSPGSSPPGGAGTHASGTVASWFRQAVKLTGVPSSWIPDLETIAWYESSDNPNAVNRTAAGIAAGTPEGLMQTVLGTFNEYHMPGTPDNIFDPVANLAAAIRYIKADYGNPANTPGLIALAHGSAYTGYDQGGWLMPGGMPINQTGQPEAVLTPAQSSALQALARWAEATLGSGGSPNGGGPLGGVNFNYFGTQHPGVEQRAMMRRDLALALSGGTP
jgi:hypothetical protein